MNSLDINSDNLKLIKEYAIKVLNKYSDNNIYTNIDRLFRVLNNIIKIIENDNYKNADKELVFFANYISHIADAQLMLYNEKLDEQKSIDQILIQINNELNIDLKLLNKAKIIAIEALPKNTASSLEAEILSDAFAMDFACDLGRDRIKHLYEQMLLRDIDISRSNWYDIIIPIVSNYQTYTSYGKEKIQPLIQKLLERLVKEKKEIEHRNNVLLQKELQISEKEIKKLKKDLHKISRRDDRGIQTLFRNTSRNHYTLNQMVDGKAKIMISINSIILSLILGGIVGNFQNDILDFIPATIFVITNLISITFAIISISPNKTQGNFTENEIRAKSGNLLYFGNFHNMHYRDFEWAFLQILMDRDYLYSSMIRDYYYQSQILYKKYSQIRISLFSFLFGLGLTIISILSINVF